MTRSDVSEEAPVSEATARDLVAYYHQPVKGPLLRGAILPLAQRWTAQGLTVQVERHWLHGPHLRLRIDSPDAALAGLAATQGAADLRTWLREHPSRSDRSAADLLAEAVEAGRAELIAPPYGPIRPDNTVRVEHVEQGPLRSLLGADGLALRDDLQRLALPALQAGSHFLGEHGDRAPARLQLAVAALTAHAAAHPGGLIGGHYSYVSHLEDFLTHEDPDGRLRRTFEQHWQDSRAAVTGLVGRIAGGSAAGWERGWADWSTAAWQLTAARLRGGADLHGHPSEYRARAAATGDAAQTERWDGELRSRYSEFHRLLHRCDPQGLLFQHPDYLVYRTCTNALYRLLAICDLRPQERYLAAHLVVRAVPALTGHHWREQLDEVIAAVEART